MKEMFIPEGRTPTTQALMECAKAMLYMREIGWTEEQIPALEKVWWQVRDDYGHVAQPEGMERSNGI